MIESLVRRLQNIDNENIHDINSGLNEFIKEHANNTSFIELNNNNLRTILWDTLFTSLNKSSSSHECKLQCLTIIKMLSREKTDLEKLITQDRLHFLTKYAELQNKGNIKLDLDQRKYEIITEALKCLCNIVYNYNDGLKMINSNDISLLICNRMKLKFKNPVKNYGLKLFDMKFLFLLTALNESNRVNLYKNGHTLKLFIEMLQDELKVVKKNENEKGVCVLSEDQFKFLCEFLKTFFNILMPIRTETGSKQKELLTKQRELVRCLRDLLLIETSTTDLGLHGHVINLLTLMPLEVLNELIVPGHDVKKTNLKDNPGMLAVARILNYLDVMLTVTVGKSPIEALSPVLMVLLHLAQTSSLFRKYLKMEVLPNLKEVHKRPEEGDSLRSKLCRLLTSPMDSVREPVADFLFTLCREDVGRMVKYTGYGNSAGLFARRGLSNGPLSYSSDSDSDTEEYTKHKDEIDPVLGCLPGPKDTSIEEMTEEQKEYLAVELANKIDKLQREGIIQPCTIGADGKPQPLEHVLELQMQEKLNFSCSNGSTDS